MSCEIFDPKVCRHLYAVSKDPGRLTPIWTQLMSVLERPTFSEKEIWPVIEHAGGENDGFGIDWNSLGIPIDRAILSIVGDGKTYNPALVEEMSLSQGHRIGLNFQLLDFDASAEQRKILGEYRVFVSCENAIDFRGYYNKIVKDY